MVCPLCEKDCEESQLHQSKYEINELLKQLKQCDVSEKSAIIDQIKAIEESANIDSLYRVDFTLPQIITKFGLEVS